MDTRYLTSGEAARRLKVAPKTLLRAVQRGQIAPAYQTPGGRLRFDVAAIETYARGLAYPPRPATAPAIDTPPARANSHPTQQTDNRRTPQRDGVTRSQRDP